MSTQSWALTALSLSAALLTGCCCTSRCVNSCIDRSPKPLQRTEAIVTYTAVPVTVDGKLDEAVWQKTPAYRYYVADEVDARMPRKYFVAGNARKDVWEGATVQLAWDDNFLYAAFNFQDSDVVADGQDNQSHLYNAGDVAELFIKPALDTYYWECYVTPNQLQTAYFITGRGTLFLPTAASAPPMPLKVAAQVNGTLNVWQDKDQGWTAEMALPIKELEKHGQKFNPETPWTIFFGRYNYSRYLPVKELSSFPQQQITNYHSLEDYASLKLVK